MNHGKFSNSGTVFDWKRIIEFWIIRSIWQLYLLVTYFSTSFQGENILAIIK